MAALHASMSCLQPFGPEKQCEIIGWEETWYARTALSEGMLLEDMRITSATAVWNASDTSGSTQVG